MAGYKFGGTDLESTYGFFAHPEGLELSIAQVNLSTMNVPGRHGVYVFSQQAQPRTITVKGYIKGTSPSNVMTKIISLESYLMTDPSFATAPTDNLAGDVETKNLEIPGISGLAFPSIYIGGELLRPVGARLASSIQEVTLKFWQPLPFTVSV